jgi:NADH-quinone oxidoreductase subunit H
MIDAIHNFGQGLLTAGWWGELAWPVIWNLIKITVVLMVVLGAVTYTTLWERRVLGWVQVRMGPNRVGPLGLLQPIADALKLMTKEIVRPTAAEKLLFYMGPVLTVMPALAAWSVVPFGPEFALANVNAGLLFLMAITSMESLRRNHLRLGRPTPNMRFLARCGPRRKWSAMKSPWVSAS